MVYSLRLHQAFLFFLTPFLLTLLLWTSLYFNKVNEKDLLRKEYNHLRDRLNLLENRLERLDLQLRYSRIDYLKFYYRLKP